MWVGIIISLSFPLHESSVCGATCGGTVPRATAALVSSDRLGAYVVFLRSPLLECVWRFFENRKFPERPTRVNFLLYLC
jgi:hypothetical protein